LPQHPPIPASISKDEVLTQLLISWYNSGYYAGLYEGSRLSAAGAKIFPENATNNTENTAINNSHHVVDTTSATTNS